VPVSDERLKRQPRKRLTREEGKALTRARLLESAHALFALRGYEGTSIDEIAADAGYTRGAFYSNFASKQEIMQALIGSGFDSDLVAVDEMSRESDISELASMYRRLAGEFSQNTENTLWMLEFQLAAVRHPELRPAYAEQFGRLRAGVAGMLVESFRRLGHPDPESTARYADIFIVILSGLSLVRLLDPEAVDDELFREAFDALVRGIPEVPLSGGAAPGK
jgi:AcrR family transcriptional regulator